MQDPMANKQHLQGLRSNFMRGCHMLLKPDLAGSRLHHDSCSRTTVSGSQ